MADAVFAGADEGARGQASADAVSRAAVASLAALRDRGDRTRRSERGRGAAGARRLARRGRAARSARAAEASPAERGAALVRFADRLQLARWPRCGRRASARGRCSTRWAAATASSRPSSRRGENGTGGGAARAIVTALEPSLVPLAGIPIRRCAPRPSSCRAFVERRRGRGGGRRTGGSQRGRAARRAGGHRCPASGRRPCAASARSVAAVGKILATHESWAMRVLAARAMGRLGAAGAGPEAAAPSCRDARLKDAVRAGARRRRSRRWRRSMRRPHGRWRPGWRRPIPSRACARPRKAIAAGQLPRAE